MLKQRLLTISFLLPVLLYLILYANKIVFLIVTAIVLILAVHEWLKLLKFSKNLYYMFLVVFVSLIILLGIYCNYWLYDSIIINKIAVLATVFWILAALLILLYVNFNKFQQLLCLKNNIIYGFFTCLLALLPSWLTINYIKVYDSSLLLFCCLLIIAADIGAYISGKLFGKHKLISISQGKTWEGVVGGYLSSILVAIIYIKIFYVAYNWQIILAIMSLTTIIFVFSVVGDLFESLFKRISGVKDSGNILPGHGGVLDRIDSFCSAVPVFCFFILLLNDFY